MGSISLFLVLKNRLFYIEPWCTSNASTKGLFSIWVKIGRCEEKTTLSSYTPLNQSYQLQVSKIATFLPWKPKDWHFLSSRSSLQLLFHPNCLIGSKCTNSSQRPICRWPLIPFLCLFDAPFNDVRHNVTKLLR